MKSLHPEIIHEEILPRLPVKSLLRFRCVSKSWRSLIGSGRFIKTQHQHSIQIPSFPQQRVILQNNYGLPMQSSLPSLSSEEPIDPSPLDDPAIGSSTSLRVLGCYNGLVCVRKFSREFYLWNPSTRISIKLPEIANRRWRVQNCGFGWDESSGEYKVFALVYDGWHLSSRKGRVYSSKTKSWKTIEHNFTDLPSWLDEAGVFVGGKLHWRNIGENYDIIFLDLKSEVFGRIELSFPLPFVKGNEVLGQIGGCLCVLLYRYRWSDIQVWVMKESWERLVDLSLDHELLQRPFSASLTQKGSNGEIFVFDGSTLLVYNPRSNVFHFPKVCCRYDSNHVYIESLLSPKDV